MSSRCRRPEERRWGRVASGTGTAGAGGAVTAIGLVVLSLDLGRVVDVLQHASPGRLRTLLAGLDPVDPFADEWADVTVARPLVLRAQLRRRGAEDLAGRSIVEERAGLAEYRRVAEECGLTGEMPLGTEDPALLLRRREELGQLDRLRAVPALL